MNGDDESVRAPRRLAHRRAAGSPARPKSRVDLLKDYSILGFLLALFVVLAATSDAFLTAQNLNNVLDQSVAVGLLACAGGMVIMGGGFDLSAGAIYVLSAVLAAKVANATNAEIGIAAGILAGMALGGVNAVICTIGRINAFVGTLATSIFFSGAATAITGGGFTYIDDPNFGKLSSKILGIFARLDMRDGKPQYLRHMPRVWNYLQRSLAHPTLGMLSAWYREHVPALNTL